MANEIVNEKGTAATSATSELKKYAISRFTVFIMIFVLVCGGYFGIENIVSSSGPGLAILILVLFPIFWAVPQALIASELGSALPEEGGYYKWVQRAFGEFWGFQVGWWRTISCYVDSALYIVLAAGYIGVFVELTDLQSYLVKATLVLFFTWINYRGIQEVGRLSNILTIYVFITLIVFLILGFSHWQYNPVIPFVAEGQTIWQSLGFGIAICIWFFSGYESMGTMAGEMKNPQLISKMSLLTIPVVILVYVSPILAGMAFYGDYASWSADGAVNFVSMAGSFGIPGLLLAFTIGAVACNLSLYNAYLASGSRGFFVIADDKLAPPVLTKVNKKHGTPHIAIFSMTIVNLILVQFGFSTLVVIDVMLFMFAYLVWFLSAVALRVKEPALPRPFRIPVGTVGMALMCIIPVFICITAFFTNGISYLLGGAIGLISGPIVYVIFKYRYGGMNQQKFMARKERPWAIGLTIVLAIVIAVGGVLFANNRADAYAGFQELYEQYFAASYEKVNMHADLEQDSFAMPLTDLTDSEVETVIWYYQGEFTGDVYLGGAYDDEMDFARAAFRVTEALGGSAEDGLPLSYAEIYSDDYYFYIEYGEVYASAQEIYDYYLMAE